MKLRSTLAAIFLAGAGLQLQAQVTVNLNLAPPYSPYFSDYLTYENKTTVQLIKPATGGPSQVYLGGKIEGDNGVSVRTKPNWRPLTPIPLNTAITQLNGSQIADYFAFSNVDFIGMTAAEAAQNNGLKEGNYTICIDVYDWNSNALVGTGCFSFPIVQPEAPKIAQPACESHIKENTQQFVGFNWWPATGGAPPNTRYTLTIAEMFNPAQNPNDVLNTVTTPPFFERDNGASLSYSYKLSDPTLIPGRYYAWRVQAYDPLGKTLFRNNGLSEACRFLYAPANASDTALVPQDQLLQITRPLCDPKKGKDTVWMNPVTPASFSWLWYAQLGKNSPYLSDPTKLVVNGQKPALYKITLLQTVKGPAQKSLVKPLSMNIAAPTQLAELRLADALKFGMLSGGLYRLEVEAFSANQTLIAKAASCDFALAQRNETDGGPSVHLQGRIVYRFAQANGLYPANHTTLTMQIASKSLAQVKGTGWAGAGGGIQSGRPYANITTDADGSFACNLGLLASDTGKRNLQILVNSPYYLTRNEPVAVQLSYVKKDPNDSTKVMVYGRKDTIDIGEVQVWVHSYDLHVKVGKGFPSFFVDSLSQKIGYTYDVDNLSIDTSARVPAGMPFRLYRKSKENQVPFYEAGRKVLPGTADKNGEITVADGKTFVAIENGREVTRVVFNNLVLNLSAGDRYYLRAVLPEKKPGNSGSNPFSLNWQNTHAGIPGSGGFQGNGGNLFQGQNPVAGGGGGSGAKEDPYADLEGPEIEVRFNQKKSLFSTQIDTHRVFKTEYRLISLKPPMSTLSGRMVYRWPSDPAAVRPLANARVQVKVVYLVDGKPLQPPMKAEGCKITISKLYNGNGNYGSDENYLQTHDEDLIVGVGQTDAQGYFKLNVINHNLKGLVTNNAVFIEQSIKDPACDEHQQQNMEQEILGEKGIWDENEDWGMSILGKNGFKGGQNILDFSGDGFNGKNGIGGSFGFNSNGVTGMNPGAGGAGFNQKGMQGGPLPPGYENLNLPPGMKLERVFMVELDPQWMRFYTTAESAQWPNPSYGNHFTAKAFESKELGQFTAIVNEITTNAQARVPIKVFDGNTPRNDINLAGSKVVVFRLPNTTIKNKPDGEGTPNHPMRKLLAPVFKGSYEISGSTSQDWKNTVMEWVRDEPLELQYDGKENYVVFPNKLLLESYGAYYVQVAPDPEKGANTFTPVVFPITYAYANIKLLPSRITGRLLDESSSKPVKGGYVRIKTPGMSDFQQVPCDDSGYFEIVNGRQHAGGVACSWNDGASITLQARCWGYTYSEKNFTINKTGQQMAFSFQLKPGGKVIGKVVDENGIPLEVYIIRGDQMVFENKVGKGITMSGPGKVTVVKTGGNFEIPATSMGNHSIRILPKDLGYFDTSFTFFLTYTKDLGTIQVFRRKHRIRLRLQLQNAEGLPLMAGGGGPKNTVRAIINNDPDKSAANSSNAYVIDIPPFENVSSTQFTALLGDAAQPGMGLIPISLNLQNKESRDWVEYNVTLRLGRVLTGIVQLNGKPVKNARVYVDQSSSPLPGKPGKTGWSQLQARSGNDGKYRIDGIPNISTGLIVHATLDTSFTTIGAKGSMPPGGSTHTLNLEIKAFEGPAINSLYGFPLSVESLTELKKDLVRVSGMVDLGSSGSSLTWLNPGTKVRVRNVDFDISGPQPKALKTETELDATAVLKMKYRNRYNVDLIAEAGANLNPKNLRLGSNQHSGHLDCYARIADNSFDFPSTYLSFAETGPFYLGVQKQGGNISTKIRAIQSAIGGETAYKLCNSSGGNLNFTFAGFKASADAAASYVDTEGRLRMKITVTGNIPNSPLKQVKFTADDVVIDNDKVYPATSSTPLVLEMEKWKLEVRNWTLDPAKGGLYSSQALIKTGILDIPAATFNLRHDLFVLDDFVLGNISLGGGTLNLKNVSSKAIFLYDEACGYDISGHWRLAISKGPAGYAAMVDGLNPTLNGSLKIDYIQLISNGVDVILSMQNQTFGSVFGNDRVSFEPKMIVSGGNNFKLVGDARFDVPRMPTASMALNFTRSGSNLTAQCEALLFEFEARGYVKFKGAPKAPEINAFSKAFTIYGTVAEPEKFNPIPAQLVIGKKDGQKGRVFLNTNEIVYLVSPGSSGPSLQLSADQNKNGMWVDGADWNLFRFSGKYKDNTMNGVVKNDPDMDFVVHGEIKASSNAVSMNQISTPFGELEMTYDFGAKRLHGLLVIPEGTQIGSWEVDGQVETIIDPGGFVVVGLGRVNTGTIFVEGYGMFKIGFVLGGYNLTDALIKKATTYTVNPNAQCWLQANKSNFKGFWFCGANQFINEHYDFYAVIANAYIHADATLEASLGVNFNASTFNLGLGAYVDVRAGMSAITGTSISGHINASAQATINYNKGLTFDALGDFSCGYEICQSLLVDEVCYGNTIGAGLNFGYNGSSTYFNFSLGNPGNFKGCKAAN